MQNWTESATHPEYNLVSCIRYLDSIFGHSLDRQHTNLLLFSTVVQRPSSVHKLFIFLCSSRLCSSCGQWRRMKQPLRVWCWTELWLKMTISCWPSYCHKNATGSALISRAVGGSQVPRYAWLLPKVCASSFHGVTSECCPQDSRFYVSHTQLYICDPGPQN